MTQVMIVYSNAEDQSRLRLDREQKVIEAAAEKNGIPKSQIEFSIATTRVELARILDSETFRVIQFSGHGSTCGFYLESANGTRSELLTPGDLRCFLEKVQSGVKLLIFLSCFSSNSIEGFIDLAPFLITMNDEVGDQAAIDFLSTFYEIYFRHGSVERAFGVANFAHSEKISATLTKRFIKNNEARQVVAIYSKKNLDPMYLDLTEATPSISRLDLSHDYLVSILGRKINVHRWIFEEPRTQAILSIGPYFGVFSWESPEDVITCHKILRVKIEVPTRTIELWAKLIVHYNDLYMSDYRLLERAVDRSTAISVERAIQQFRNDFQFFFNTKENMDALAAEDVTHFSAIRATLQANLDKAEIRLRAEDYSKSVIFLETALSCMHDFIDSLVGRLAD